MKKGLMTSILLYILHPGLDYLEGLAWFLCHYHM